MRELSLDEMELVSGGRIATVREVGGGALMGALGGAMIGARTGTIYGVLGGMVFGAAYGAASVVITSFFNYQR